MALVIYFYLSKKTISKLNLHNINLNGILLNAESILDYVSESSAVSRQWQTSA